MRYVAGFDSTELSIAIDHIEVKVESRSDNTGMFDMGDAAPPGPLDAVMSVTIRSAEAPAEALREMVDWCVAHSPMADALTRAVPLDVVVDIG